MERKEQIELVKELGKKIGYGNIMQISSDCWKDELVEKGFPTDWVAEPVVKSEMKIPDSSVIRSISENLRNSIQKPSSLEYNSLLIYNKKLETVMETSANILINMTGVENH